MILIGAGAHARTLVQGQNITGYIDPRESKWCTALHLPEDYDLTHHEVIVGFCGITVDGLERRFGKIEEYATKSSGVPAIIHHFAIINDAMVEDAVHILPRAMINANAVIMQGAVINTGAIIEHDAIIGRGCHIAPGAIVLGGAEVGDFSFVGAGAIIVQGVSVPPRSFIKAGTVWKP